MNKKDRFLYTVGVLFIMTLYILTAVGFAVMGVCKKDRFLYTVGVLFIMTLYILTAVGFVFMGAYMFGIIAIIYCLTIVRFSRYAKHLQEAGYGVYLHRIQIWHFTMWVLLSCLNTLMAVGITYRFYTIRPCFQAGECGINGGWIVGEIFMVVMIWPLAMLATSFTIIKWWESFHPLRRLYIEMRLGHTLDLPRRDRIR